MRNRYLDLLRAAAIVRVVVYHSYGWPWLSIVFPAMGVMFAVAGSLTAASLDDRPAGAVVASRVRRLLPPVWLLGLVTVPLMLHSGWRAETDGTHPFQPATLGFWILPLGDPPGSDDAAFVWDALWYVRTYLWLVLLSPLLYPLFKRIGWPLLAAPLLGMALLGRGDFGMPAAVESALWDLTTYGACWLAGFAHRDGRLARLHPALTVAAAVALGGLGLYWLGQDGAESGGDLNDASEAQAAYCLAGVLLLLRWQPSTDWMGRAAPVRKLVTLLNSRAVTIYLWHGVAIAATWPVLERIGMDDLGALETPVTLAVTVALTTVAVAVFGWAEDLAARRRPRIWPTGGSGPAAEPAAEPATEVTPLPAGWPETVPAAEPAIQRTVRDMPVAGRRPESRADDGWEGVPWSGPDAPSQGGHPLPLRFTGGDGNHL
ncbi:acyltransferase family protein [Actinoplanes utahensis]|uniref:acyltransferase family protein n=1 Tax=Actinoplanes utahensis TaxID=1869 RepID=UPI000A05ED88|nr:acyltransferase [Actinoplanes utahensis]